MKRASSSNGMRIALQVGFPLLGPSTTRRLDVNPNSFLLHHSGRYPKYPQTRLRTSVISRSPLVYKLNLHVRTPGRVRSRAYLYINTGLSFVVTPQQPLPPPRKLWYDKLADALLGDDESSMNAAASRYALICQKCFSHNGLVKEEMWEGARTHDLLLSY